MRLALRLVFPCIAFLCVWHSGQRFPHGPGGGVLNAQESGYTYTVQPGDSWPLVAQRVGLTVQELQEANPDAGRPNGWLIVGERLFIPTAPGWEERFYIAQRGDGWKTVAERFGVSVQLLQAANPKLRRPGDELIVGERLLIPALLPTPTGAASQGASQPTAAPTGDRAPLTISTATEPATLFAPRISLPLPTPVTLPPCPHAPNDLGQTLTALWSIPNANRYGQLTDFLADCGAELKILTNADLNGDRVDDALLVYRPSRAGAGARAATQEKLVILRGGKAHSLSFATTANGAIELLATQDINADDRTDVVWTDTACAANACFLTVQVHSWDGATWRDWTKGTISMASANVSLTTPAGAGRGMPKEIRLTGGTYTGADAGPQRTRTAVWTSADGAPYALSKESLAPSDCLYHTLLDANRALVDHTLADARRLYTQAVENKDLTACWKRDGELAELRSFALFRLALTLGYLDDPEGAAAVTRQLESEYASQLYTSMARRWLQIYRNSGDPRAACQVVSIFAAITPAVADLLDDYGYANPTFTTEDVCPLLDIAPPAHPQPRLAQIEAALGVTPDCPTDFSEDYLSGLPVAVNLVAAGLAAASDPQGELNRNDRQPVSRGQEPQPLPTDDRQRAAAVLEPVEAWLRACGALNNERGELLIHDLNGDGLVDVIAALADTREEARRGAQGLFLILHQQQDGSYRTAYAPATPGEPAILALGDANGDDNPDIVWQLERCAAYCLLTVNAITWDNESASYQSVIESGATIAEGRAWVDLTEEETSALPRIRRLWLSGGASGADQDGLSVSHTEIWYSVDGSPLRRFTWSYDRTNEASNCLGLRLIEANVALQAVQPGQDPPGYATAIELYRAALDSPALQPCTTQGRDPEEEMTLLRGLANFRLVQILTLNGDSPAAEAQLETLPQNQRERSYADAARAWLNAYYSVPDPVAACAAAMSIFLDNPDLWQITEEFGHDHPALTLRQICYAPGREEGDDFRITPNW